MAVRESPGWGLEMGCFGWSAQSEFERQGSEMDRKAGVGGWRLEHPPSCGEADSQPERSLSCSQAAAAAAAKSLQSCPTLCDPIDGSPPGSPVPWILQARTLEWMLTGYFRSLLLWVLIKATWHRTSHACSEWLPLWSTGSVTKYSSFCFPLYVPVHAC